MEKDYSRYLPSFDTIVHAADGEEKAMREVLQCYEKYITALSTENGHMTEELRGRLQGKLMRAVLKFDIDRN